MQVDRSKMLEWTWQDAPDPPTAGDADPPSSLGIDLVELMPLSPPAAAAPPSGETPSLGKLGTWWNTIKSTAKEFLPISSRFGWRFHPVLGSRSFHSGLDLAAPMGAPIGAARAGKVIFAGPKGPNGNLVQIDHGDGTVSSYAHNSKILVRVGQRVVQGEPIARVGSTGRSTGPHLHFEIRRHGKLEDPKPLLDSPYWRSPLI